MVRIWFYSLCSVGLVGCVAGGERLDGSKYIGGGESVAEPNFQLMSMPVVKIQTDNDGEI